MERLLLRVFLASIAMAALLFRPDLGRHHPPPGRRNAPPDDRLQQVIQ